MPEDVYLLAQLVPVDRDRGRLRVMARLILAKDLIEQVFLDLLRSDELLGQVGVILGAFVTQRFKPESERVKSSGDSLRGGREQFAQNQRHEMPLPLG